MEDKPFSVLRKQKSENYAAVSHVTERFVTERLFHCLNVSVLSETCWDFPSLYLPVW